MSEKTDRHCVSCQKWHSPYEDCKGNKIANDSRSSSCSLSFDPTDPEILWILGRPCFACGPIAHILKAAGQPIDPKAEKEQATAIIWMIQKYQEYGEGWKSKADEDLAAMRKKVNSRIKELFALLESAIVAKIVAKERV